MNCKPGDLAFIAAPGRKSDGTIVRCIEFVGVLAFFGPFGGYDAPAWRLDREYITFDGHRNNICPDKFLRPIRDPGDDAVDEMVQKLGKPEGVTA